MSSDEEEEWPEVEQPPEFDIKVAQALVATLQSKGENVLMDELIDAAAPADEWEVTRVLDVLVGLQLAGIERQRGNTLRNSRAFAYRTGYALPKPVPLENLKESLEQQESAMEQRLSNVKRLKEQLENGNSDNDIAFLQSYIQNHEDDEIKAFIKRILEQVQ